MTYQQYTKIDSIFEDNIKKTHKIPFDLPYDYTNNILLVVDGTGTRKVFEASYNGPKDGVPKGSEYQMTQKARWYKNGNWKNHCSNFYEDYRGVKYYWYGPDQSVRTLSAGLEVHRIVEGVVDIVCEFITNATINGKYKVSDINIDLIGYSRGGYAVMEAARKLDRDGCPNIVDGHEINIRFMGLYDPVSTMTYCESWFSLKYCHSSVIAGDDNGLYANDKNKYKSDQMPVNVEHIVISYGDPDIGSRAYFNTAEDKEDNDKREEVEYKYYQTTHGGAGGNPLDGDFDSNLRKLINMIVGDIQLDEDLECSNSMKADMFIRSKANEYGLPIHATTKDYYGFVGCDGHLKE